MAIKGSLKEASLPDVLQLLSMGQKTGVLSVTDRNNFGNVYLDGGKVVYATMVNRMDRIGDLLVRDGKIGNHDLEEAIRTQQDAKKARRLGEILVELGKISSGELAKYLRIQIEETIYTMLSWEDGFFHFEPDKKLGKDDIKVSLPTNDLLMEGARKVDEWKNVEKTIPSTDVVVAIKDSELLKKMEIPQRYSPLVSLVNGDRTIDSLCGITGIDSLEACKFFERLILDGVLYIKEEKKKKAPSTRLSISQKTEYLNLGMAFYKTGMYFEAEREFQKLLDLDEDNLDALFYMGLVRFETEEYEETVQYYERALKVSPHNAKIYNNLGVALEREGSASGAFVAYRKAIQFDSNYAKAYHNFGYLYFQKGDYDNAVNYFKKAIECDDKMDVSYFYLGLTLIYMKKTDYALMVYEQAIEDGKGDAIIHNNIGAVYQFKRQREESINHYKEAIRKNTNLATPHRNLGNIYYQDGWHDKASVEYKRAIEIDDTLSDVFFKLGNIHLKEHKREEAIKNWTKALELDPTNEVIKRNLEVIKNTSSII